MSDDVKTGRASEGGTHWYTRDGRAAYEVKAKTGTKCPACGGSLKSAADKARTAACGVCNERGLVFGMKPTTLREARELGLLYGVSTIVRSAAKPGLDAWRARQVAMAAATGSHLDDYRAGLLSDDAVVAAILADADRQANDAAAFGTARHAAVEGYFRGEPVPPEHERSVQAILLALEREFGTGDGWIPEKVVVNPNRGYGGLVDLVHYGLYSIVDLKGMDLAPGDKPPRYDEHLMQLCGYQGALPGPFNTLTNVFFSRTHDDVVVVRKYTDDEADRGWAMFNALLDYRKHADKYWPERWMSAA